MEQQIEQINNIGTLKEFKVKTEKKVSELLNELNLSDKFFAILINGKKVSLNSVIKAGENIVLLPKIAGG